MIGNRRYREYVNRNEVIWHDPDDQDMIHWTNTRTLDDELSDAIRSLYIRRALVRGWPIDRAEEVEDWLDANHPPSREFDPVISEAVAALFTARTAGVEQTLDETIRRMYGESLLMRAATGNLTQALVERQAENPPITEASLEGLMQDVGGSLAESYARQIDQLAMGSLDVNEEDTVVHNDDEARESVELGGAIDVPMGTDAVLMLPPGMVITSSPPPMMIADSATPIVLAPEETIQFVDWSIGGPVPTPSIAVDPVTGVRTWTGRGRGRGRIGWRDDETPPESIRGKNLLEFLNR